MTDTVTTVIGDVSVDDLGITLPHEHLLNDVTSWHGLTSQRGWDPDDFAHRPVTSDIVWDLRHDPFGNIDNCRLDSVEVACEEVARFADLGGRTILDATGAGIGRDLAGLRTISEATGVLVVAGTGHYLDSAQSDEIKAQSIDQLVEGLLSDLAEGEDGIRPGMIGEIGVGAEFTPAERRSLQAAARAQVATGLPMQVHLPGWFRLGDEVLDVVEAEGVDPSRVVLCHMGPSGRDVAYQQRLANRGAWIQYDMVGMEVFYADQGVQCPSDEDNARSLARLLDAGHIDRLLISQDVFLKSLLRRHGGPGYAHILQYFVPRLHRHGFTKTDVDTLLVDNPRRLFADGQPAGGKRCMSLTPRS